MKLPVQGELAQSGERALHRGEVMGSSPIFSTIENTEVIDLFSVVSHITIIPINRNFVLYKRG